MRRAFSIDGGRIATKHEINVVRRQRRQRLLCQIYRNGKRKKGKQRNFGIPSTCLYIPNDCYKRRASNYFISVAIEQNIRCRRFCIFCIETIIHWASSFLSFHYSRPRSGFSIFGINWWWSVGGVGWWPGVVGWCRRRRKIVDVTGLVVFDIGDETRAIVLVTNRLAASVRQVDVVMARHNFVITLLLLSVVIVRRFIFNVVLERVGLGMVRLPLSIRK